ncbi:hypothetical protein M5585_19100 [Serratia ureilytica]
MSIIKISRKRAYDQLVRVKAELIGELLAEWVSLPTDKRKLKLANEAFLWLPADLATELSKVLTHEPDAIGYRELMSKIRTYLHGQDDSFESYRFVTWENTESE